MRSISARLVGWSKIHLGLRDALAKLLEFFDGLVDHDSSVPGLAQNGYRQDWLKPILRAARAHSQATAGAATSGRCCGGKNKKMMASEN
jgi:hypothetical protein